MTISITLILVAINVAVSLYCFQDEKMFYRLSLHPYSIKNNKEWYRIFTHAFVHADVFHLFVNMFVLYNFGSLLEGLFTHTFGAGGWYYFLLMYLGGIVFSTPTALKRHQDNPRYNAVGASGATSAVVFSFIVFMPMQKLYLFLAIPIPALLFGIMYLVFEVVMDKRGRGNIAHDAHFWGAVFGFFYTLLLDLELLTGFFEQIANSFGS